MQRLARAQDLPAGSLAPRRQRSALEAAGRLVVEAAGSADAPQQFVQGALDALEVRLALPDRALVKVQSEHRVAHRIPRTGQPVHGAEDRVPGRQVLDCLRRQAVRLVEHVQGLCGRRQRALSAQFQRREHEVVVGDHQIGLPDALACSLVWAAREVGTRSAGAVVAVSGGALPQAVADGFGKRVAVAAPTPGMQGIGQLAQSARGGRAGVGSRPAVLERQIALPRALRLGVELGWAGVALAPPWPRRR
ncbi:MAG: hypothetical protein JSS18_02915 [Proteobacteria bacterium]|nr:hypothetical protein [Pseudomonadota bacterium]